MRGRLGLVAHPGEHVEVEVRAPGAHAAGVEGEERPHHVGAPLDVVARHDHQGGGDLEASRPWPGARAAEALGQARAVERVVLGREEQRQPAVAQLGGQGHVLRALGGEVDRQVGPQRVDRRLQRLAEPDAARVGQLVVLALEVDRLVAGDDLADDGSTYSRVRASGLG